MRPGLKTPFFIILLPAFFFLHALSENYNVTLIKDALVLFLIYTGFSVVLTFVFWLFYKNIQKAALAAFILMSVNFFFGSTYDFFKRILNDSFITRFSFLLPAIFIFIAVSLYLISKSKKKYQRIGLYLNILFMVLILIDVVLLLSKISGSNKNHVPDISTQLAKCDTCSKPDIYLIVADEYAGKKQLEDLFSYNNTSFETELTNRGFHLIKNSSSNYNGTIYSVASLLNMNYISNLQDSGVISYRDMLTCRRLVKKSQLLKYLKSENYIVYNNSFMDVDNKEKTVEHLFSSDREILIHQTFIKRFIYIFGARLASKSKLTKLKQRVLSDNQKIEQQLNKVLEKKDQQPRFVYSHFHLPHWPYYFDKNGNETDIGKITDEFRKDRKAYIEYLQYSNKQYLSLIDRIRKSSTSPPVIILISDHGFRQFNTEKEVDHKYYFMNLNAVYLPSGDYSGFYDGMTNVNQFRVILNTVFGQKLPMLKDSVSFIWDSQ